LNLEPKFASENGKLLFRDSYDYSVLEGQSITLLKEMIKSPKHYRYRQRFQKKWTGSMSMGTTSHTAVLEPERFLKDYAIWKSTGADGKTRQRRGEKWEEFQKQNEGKTIVKDDEYDEAISLRDAVRKDEIAMKYLAMGEPEVALQWTDVDTGILCRGRIDWLTKINGEYCIVDLKTTRNADPILFSRDCAKLGYHLQLAYYADAVELATGEFPRCIVVAAESSPPYDVVTYVVPDEVLDVGRVVYKELLERLKQCQASNEWPGQGNMMERTLTLPAWCNPGEESEDMNGLDLEGLEAA
jgi:PDDEXK-like uncharacterized protein DUF3799